MIMETKVLRPVEWAQPPVKVIYVAGAFRSSTQWGIMQNVQHAERASLRLWKQGYSVICPHTMTQHFQNECPDELWLNGMIELLKRSDAIYMLTNWYASEGSREELRVAQELGIRVMYEGENDDK
jgi:hypothetical protein